MGILACIAKWNAPFLNGKRSGLLNPDLVPSTKIHTLCF